MALSVLCAVCLLSVAGPARSQTLYGVRGTNLITINPTNPASTAVVGPTGLGAGTVSFLAYHPGESALFGIRYGAGPAISQDLVRINPLTGAGTVVANLGTFTGVGAFETLEYVNALNSLVLAQSSGPNISFTKQLKTVSPTGTLSATLVTLSPTDNDYGVYDTNRNIFYTYDGNDLGQIAQINLANGIGTALGGVPTTAGDPAYSPTLDAIFFLDGANLARLNTTNGGAPTNFVTVGAVGGGAVDSIAFAASASAPEPGTLALAGLGLVGVGIGAVRRRRG